MSRSILHLVRTMDPESGGPVSFLKQLCAAHVAMGIRVAILTLDRHKPAWSGGLPIAVIECGPSRGTYGYNPGLEDRLASIVGSFDAMVVHGLWQYHGVSAMRASARSGVPYLVFPHGMLDPWFKRAYPIKHLKKQIYWALNERRLLEGAKSVLFTSRNEMRLAERTFLPKARSCDRLLPIGVEKSSAESYQLCETFFQRFPQMRGRRFLLFLGRLHPKKGCDLLIEAMSRTRPPLHLVFAGPDADEKYTTKLVRSASGLPIQFTGMLHDEVKAGALAAAEALILPSHQENFGLVVAEALSLGTPVLLSNQVNIAEEVAASGAGFVEPDTLTGTERLIERWLREGSAEMRIAASNCFDNHFDIKQSARELVMIISGNG
jgi:glycosyltransferase involved in cell wall biosynthesis